MEKTLEQQIVEAFKVWSNTGFTYGPEKELYDNLVKTQENNTPKITIEGTCSMDDDCLTCGS